MRSLGFRGRPRRSCWGIGAFVVFYVGCSRTVPHDYDARNARDYMAPESAIPRKAHEPEKLAVLLVPTNTIVFRPNVRSNLNIPDNPDREWYVGPARVFLPPGYRRYKVQVQGAEGVFDLDLDADFEAGKRYELSIIEDGDEVAFELFELHPTESTGTAAAPGQEPADGSR